MTSNILIFLVGGLIGFFFSLDVCYKPKKKGSFVKLLALVVSTSVPAIISAFFNEEIAKITSEKISFFYFGFILTFIVVVAFIYFRLFLPLINKLEKKGESKNFTILDLFKDGYSSFKDEFDVEWNKVIDENKKERSLYKDTLEEIRPSYLTFINDINSKDYFNDLEIEVFLTTVITQFIYNFFGDYNARLTLREYDQSTNSMITKITTRKGTIPKPIPLDKPNLVSKSAELSKPLIYSENLDFHFNTSNSSIEQGVYSDYVTYCLLEDENDNPVYSISLDVKGKTAALRMKTLVHSLGYDILCWTIIKKFIYETSS